jgi:hypothetical protein
MKNIFKRSRFGITAVIIVFLLAGCENDPDDNPDPVIPPDITVEVRISSSSTDVLRGEEVAFLASVKGTDNRTVAWSIDEADKHQETKIFTNERGETYLSVSEDETIGTLTVRATSNADPEKSGSVTVTIPVPIVDKVEISLAEPWVVPWQGRIDAGPGGEVEFTVKVTGKDFIREAVTWSIDNAGKQANTTINVDANGVAQLRVAQTETLASFKVQAVSKWDAGKIGEVTVTVKEPDVTGMVIIDQDGKVVPGGSITTPARQIKTASSESFRALVTGTGKVDQNVTWKIERLSYIISILDIRLDKNNKYSEAWGSTSLEIIIDGNEITGNTWYYDGEETDDGFLIYISKPIEFDPESGGIKIWDTDGFGENELKILKPVTGTTEIDATGKFTVDALETFGKFRLTAVSTADTTIKKEVVVQIDTSSEIGIEPPPEF